MQTTNALADKQAGTGFPHPARRSLPKAPAADFRPMKSLAPPIAAAIAAAIAASLLFARAGTGARLLVMVPKGEHPYYEPCYEGFKDAGAKRGVKTEIRVPASFKVADQARVIEDLVSKHVNGIAVSAVDDKGLAPAIEKAARAGIKVITFDAPAPSTAALCYIGTNNDAAGYQAGEEIFKAMQGEGELAVLQGGLDAPNLNERFQGLERFLNEKAPGIKIVAREDNGGTVEMAATKTREIMEKHPNLRAIFGVSAEVVPGAATVVKEQGKAGKILVAGFDDLPVTLDGIREGVVSFCLAQRTYKMGWLSVEKLLDAIDDKVVPKHIDTGILVVNRENVDIYMRKYQSILRTR